MEFRPTNSTTVFTTVTYSRVQLTVLLFVVLAVMRNLMIVSTGVYTSRRTYYWRCMGRVAGVGRLMGGVGAAGVNGLVVNWLHGLSLVGGTV